MALVSTRCPVAKDDAPEFMHDVPHTKLGDLLPEAISCKVFDQLGEYVGNLDVPSCAGRITVLCAFDPTCCICQRFALPRLQLLWKRIQSNSECYIVALGRDCDLEALQRFRGECSTAAQRGDRHITELSFPMAPDVDAIMFHTLADAIVPRFYLLGPDGSILLQQGGFSSEDFDTLEYCLDQELMYL